MRMYRLTVAVLLALTALLAPFAASAASSSGPNRPGLPPRVVTLPQPAIGTIVLTATNTGWYDSTGFHDATNTNYIAGDCTSLCGNSSPTHYRNYFVFDLRGVVGTITGATLIVADPNDNPPLGTYSLYGVGSAISYVEASHTGATNIYSDLGTGTVYGSITPQVNVGFQVIPLNAGGVQAVRRAEAAQIRLAFGGNLPAPAGSDQVMFGFSGGNLSQIQLVLNIR